MNIEKLTKLLEILSVDEKNNSTDVESVYKIGEKYFIRTVTMYIVGRLIKVTNQELLLTDASWIPDTGKFYDSLKTGDFYEVEPFFNKETIVGRGAIIDATIYDHDLPTKVKP